MIYDAGDKIVTKDITKVIPHKNNVDGSATFEMFGGPYSGGYIRVYQPYMRVVFQHPTKGIIVYDLQPPVHKDAKWLYVYDPDDTRPPTDAEKGDTQTDAERDIKWYNWTEWKRKEEFVKMQRLERKRREQSI